MSEYAVSSIRRFFSIGANIMLCVDLKVQYGDVALFFNFSLLIVRKIEKNVIFLPFLTSHSKNRIFLNSHKILIITPILNFINDNES